MKLLLAFIPLIGMLLETDSCGNATPTSADRQQAQQQAALAQESNSQVGVPGVTKFTEKRLMRQLYELRDKNVATFTYLPDLQGRLWHVCDSIGYGLPYGTQFTNPQYVGFARQEYGVATLPQPEPNGLFMPPTAEGTWIVCTNAKGDINPMYVEPRVIVSPFKLKSAGDYQLAADGQ